MVDFLSMLEKFLLEKSDLINLISFTPAQIYFQICSCYAGILLMNSQLRFRHYSNVLDSRELI